LREKEPERATGMETSQRVKRMKWSCRRGMKDLDVLLENFIAGFERQLDAGAWPEFESCCKPKTIASGTGYKSHSAPMPPTFVNC
jgi:hypothetical protein